MRIFILLGSHDNFGDLMLGSNEDSVGKSLLLGVGSGVFGCLPLYWEVILGWGETKVNCYLVDFQASR